MNRYLCIQAFVQVADTKSFAIAAEQLGVTKSVITSRVKKLEAFVQAPLFQRTTRTVVLTDTAQELRDECAKLLSEADSITNRMRLAQDAALGLLRVQVLPGLAVGPFVQALKEFSLEYPEIRLEITVSEQLVNPIREGYDVTLRLFRPRAEVLLERRRLFVVRRVFCASPRYLERRGTPVRPADLLEHDLGLYSGYPRCNRWKFRCGDEEIQIELPARFKSNSAHLLQDYARNGAGITCLPTLVCGDDLISGALVPLLAEFELPLLDLLAIYPPTHRGTLKVRLFVEFIRKRFSGEPEWDRMLRDLPSLESIRFRPQSAERGSAAGGKCA